MHYRLNLSGGLDACPELVTYVTGTRGDGDGASRTWMGGVEDGAGDVAMSGNAWRMLRALRLPTASDIAQQVRSV